MAVRLAHPLPASTLSDRFGWRKGIQTPNGWVPPQLHNGQDYAAAAGSLIRAAHSGRVTYVGWDDLGGGWMVKLSSANVTTMYAHNRERSPLVKLGDEVKIGQGIAYVGSTGLSTGPHLHFIMLLNGAHVDPLPYITSTPAPSKPPTPVEQEEPVMRGFFTKQGSKYKVIIFDSVSGFAHTYETGDRALNEKIANNWETKSFVEGDQSHYDKLLADLADVRRGK